MSWKAHAARLLFLSACSSVASAAVTGWRGDGSGRFPDAQPPLRWSSETKPTWSAPMPGKSNASPILVGDRLFVCSEPDTLLCVDASDGRVLWQHANPILDTLALETREQAARDMQRARSLAETVTQLKHTERKQDGALKKSPDDQALVAELAATRDALAKATQELKSVEALREPATHDVNGFTTPTPTSDGRNVYAVFGSGVVAAYDLKGTRLWISRTDTPTHEWGHSASPLLVGDKLVVHVRDVVALNATTGEEVWRTPAPPCWGSPLHTRIGTEDVVITPGGSVLRLRDGEALARGIAALAYAAPLVDGDRAYFVQHGGKAVRLSLAPDGRATAETLWETRPTDDRYYASSVLRDGLLYAITRDRMFSIIDAADGSVLISRKLNLKGTAYPSITSAGAYLYISTDGGTTVVIEPGRECREVASNQAEPFRSSPLFVGKRLYLRTEKSLLCIE